MSLKDKKYYLKHKKEMNQKSKVYYKHHKEQIKNYQHEYYLKNKEKLKSYSKQHHKSPKGKALKKKINAKRRKLNFIPLNKPFDNCEAHHINKTEVVYIPKELHQSYRHNHNKVETMVAINAAVVRWLKQKYVL